MMTTILRSRLSLNLRPLLGASACLVLALGNEAFSHAQTSTPQPVIVADFNHDGIPDALVLSTTAPTATIALGIVPYGTFSATSRVVTFPAGCTSLPQGSVLAGDFNGDGIADIAFFCNGASGVLLGNGDGTFAASKPITGAISENALTGDFNKDGKLDLVLLGLTFGPNTTAIGTLQFFAGNGDGTFAAAINTQLDQNNYTAPLVVDLNGDGYPDIALLNLPTGAPGSVNVFGNNKDGTFGLLTQGVSTANTVATVANTSSTILSGNFFGTNAIDLVVAGTGPNAEIDAFKNNSTAATYSFSDPVTTPFAGITASKAGSFTGSGLTDLVVANGTTLSVLANDGTGSFAANYSTLTLPLTTSLFAVADANGDGYSDIYTATSTNGALQLGVNVVTGSATAIAQPLHLGAGTKAISATWAGNVNFSGSNATGQEIVAGVPTVSILTSSKNPSVVGDAVTFTATVAPGTITGTAPPTGLVILSDGTNMLASGAIDTSGKFSYTTSALTQATHAILATYVGDSYFAGSASPVLSQVVNHAAAVASNLTWATPAAIVYGTALSGAQLNAVATDGTGTAIPGTFAYTPTAGTVLDAGVKTLSVTFTPADLLSFQPATQTVALTVTRAAPVLTWATPASIAYGVPLSATQLNATAAGVTGAALPGAFTYTPAAGTVLNPGVQTLSVNFVPTNAVDYTTATGSVKLTVAASVGATITAPPSTAPGSQTAITVTLSQPYPVDLIGTLTIGFIRTGTPNIVDPSLQFAEGGTTLTFPIPANTTTVPPIQLQAGTIAGTITVPLTLTADGVNVTPADLPPVTIVVPPAVPTISGMTVTRSGDQLTVVMHGFSNTREVVDAKFHFTAAPGATIGTPDLTLPALATFNILWFETDASDAYGSTFTYTQIFNTSDGAANIGSVDATLTNTVGASTTITAK